METDEKRFTCTDCGAVAPDAAGDGSTLITIKHGWRILRRQLPDGAYVVDARCPACFARFRGLSGPKRSA